MAGGSHWESRHGFVGLPIQLEELYFLSLVITEVSVYDDVLLKLLELYYYSDFHYDHPRST